MPLIIVCGRPASGKSYIATKITSAFVKKLEEPESLQEKATTTTTTSQVDNKLTKAVEEDKNKNITSTTQADISPSSTTTSTTSSFNTSSTHNTITTQNADALSKNSNSQTIPPNASSSSTSSPSFPIFYKNVIKISDSDALKELNLHRNEAFENTHKLEKRLRGNLKAATERALANKNNLVILDHGNYIKGWRYELHCMAKSTRTKSMILYIEDNDEVRFLENNLKREDKEEAYSEEIQEILNNLINSIDMTFFEMIFLKFPVLLKALNFRFETPNPKNRWDSPMETISNINHSSLNPDDLIHTLAQHFTGNATQKEVKPNNSTQQPAKSNLTDMEGVTQQIVEIILRARQDGQHKIRLPNGQIVECPGSLTVTDGEIRRARRQFFNYVRQQNSFIGGKNMGDDVAGMFIKFLKTALN